MAASLRSADLSDLTVTVTAEPPLTRQGSLWLPAGQSATPVTYQAACRGGRFVSRTRKA